MAVKHFNSDWQKPTVGNPQIKLLERLSNACAVSGDEGAVRKIILEEIRAIADKLTIDSIGNILAIKKGSGKNLPRVMLSAHMDEVGLILANDEGKGIFRFKISGGIDPRTLAGKQVWVGKEKFPGVIGLGPIHLVSASEYSGGASVDNLRIDIGPANASKVKIGDRATFATKFQQIGPSLVGKALDDRLGVATLITLLKNAPDNIDLMAAFTVQEEVGLRGAKVAAYTLNPEMGYGATLSDPRLVRFLRQTGDYFNIPYQIRQPGRGGTDAGSIHLSRAGIPAVSVSVPGRYLHTPVSIARLKDWQNSIYLLHAAISHIDSEILKEPR
ncbi:MAG: hypothetical protein P8Y68_05750 [Anaerolineales bacterium]